MREASPPEGVFACELEAERLVVSYANPALSRLLELDAESAASGQPLFDLLASWVDAATRAELDSAIEAGRQVWVRLERTADPDCALRLMIKPASVPGAWVGSVRVAESEPLLELRSAFLAEHSAAEPLPGTDDEPAEQIENDATADRITSVDDDLLDPAAELADVLYELIPELTDEAPPSPSAAASSESAASASAPSEVPGDLPSARGQGMPARESIVDEAPTHEATPADDTATGRILEPGSAGREAALARALDAAGITWLEQDLATGALSVAGRRPYDAEPSAAARGGGFERLIYPADQERRRAAFDALTTGRADELYCAYRVRDATQAWMWMLETGHLVTDVTGTARYVGTLQAVPDRESVDVAPDPHAFSSEHANAIAESFHLPGALVEIHYSAEGRIQFTFLSGRLTGVDLAEAARAPESLLARIDPGDRTELESRCALAAAEQCAWECAFGYMGADGQHRCAQLRVDPVPLEGGGALFRGFVFEDTERKRLEHALAESEKRFRQLYESAPFMMHGIDAAGLIVSVNAQWLAKLGYERDAVVGRPAERIFAPGSKRLANVETLAAEEGDGFRERECLIVAEDGRELESIASARIERDGAGALIGAHFLLIDVTDRNRAMQGLRESEARFRAVVEDQTDPVCRFGADGRILFANDACARTAGVAAEGLNETDWFELVDELQALTLRSELARLTPEQPLLQRELRMTRLDGRLFQWTIRAFFDAAGRLTEFQGVGRDMEELQQLEAQIREVSQREQRRIGHDLHDGLGQELTGVSLMLRKLELDAAAEAPGLGARVASVRRMVNQSLATARSLARGLSPLELERGGLAGALAQLAANAGEMYEVAVAVDCATDAAVHDSDVASELYRITQEAVNNAVKHGEPGEVAIRLRREGPRVVLEIEDDGTGLPAAAEAGAGLGLKIMRYRANIIGASIEFLSEPGQGTLVRCQLNRPV